MKVKLFTKMRGMRMDIFIRVANARSTSERILSVKMFPFAIKKKPQVRFCKKIECKRLIKRIGQADFEDLRLSLIYIICKALKTDNLKNLEKEFAFF